MSILNLARTNVLTLEPYQSARRIGGGSQGNIWLNANEYPQPTFYMLRSSNLNRYPDCQPQELLNSYAAYAGVQPNQVLACRGADEGIELLIRTFCEPSKDKILFCPPTYGMYRVSAETFGVAYCAIQALDNWQLDLDTIYAQLDCVKLIYICHPNNPTGNIINPSDIRQLLDITHGRTILVVDEAYIDFYPTASISSWINHYPHLVILRTLSKAFALAGLRCGFILANPDIIKLLLKVIAPYPISRPVVDIAKQALSTKGIHQTKRRVANIDINRNWLIQQLAECSCVSVVFPSVTNYLLVRFHPNYHVFQSLWKKGTILRDQNQQIGLANCLRITIGTSLECQNLLTALQALTLVSHKE
ncbi:histidinol-phosphate transaminase [Candidatus Palibaumannia cicadellinicola]|uniref:Histidinol-phosphate aminotransferase n=1 Tax=Baumannia cicadellinicola subsp. Homalodisca coagulata TaxID=374463 RepID=HIS8_BAUCH|nr:histidinol-phosphate transaminase [Candidatus Baumannia cicadellinicola]Q1LT68.1 RecName: Full=Histidinol-phosphate aminotransferase; AltName: Full=Imidazole acetol-phosphate transaminase [Baumannia cicadellinicola str. Hc (Homalodisca coagulata)]ABF14107.1 histidinol-phosphate aminotransferase [Baumannia cicadellinicola str. Hc (Homalodisca coagulata)]MBS0032827.1 histidinol-phosphate transaminase [Candidatus Baumannia cicadellinicola]MCJ7462114.1 histidinol-phosphate transaminase [Candidat